MSVPLSSVSFVSPRVPQPVLFCWVCGSGELCARGVCRRGYDTAYHDDSPFVGARARVLTRAACRCQRCGNPCRVVHPRRPGVPVEECLLPLYPACHATVEHLEVLDRHPPPLLRLLWEEKHPDLRPVVPVALDWPVLFGAGLPKTRPAGRAGKPS